MLSWFFLLEFAPWTMNGWLISVTWFGWRVILEVCCVGCWVWREAEVDAHNAQAGSSLFLAVHSAAFGTALSNTASVSFQKWKGRERASFSASFLLPQNGLLVTLQKKKKQNSESEAKGRQNIVRVLSSSPPGAALSGWEWRCKERGSTRGEPGKFTPVNPSQLCFVFYLLPPAENPSWLEITSNLCLSFGVFGLEGVRGKLLAGENSSEKCIEWQK